jgi:hypothetical protein
MSDVLSLAGLSTAALTEGIKFLYAQAGDLLRMRRERKRIRKDTEPEETPPCVAEPRSLPAVDLSLVDRFESELRALRADLHEYESGVDIIDPADSALANRVDALRRVLERIYGTPVTFVDEQRDSVTVRGLVDVDEVAGYVAAVRADHPMGLMDGRVRARRVESGGEVIGVELGNDWSRQG